MKEVIKLDSCHEIVSSGMSEYGAYIDIHECELDCPVPPIAHDGITIRCLHGIEKFFGATFEGRVARAVEKLKRVHQQDAPWRIDGCQSL